MKKCLGCGILLQHTNPLELGYAKEEEHLLCERCFQLKNYGKYTNVPLTNLDYQKVIHSISQDSVVLYVTDVFTLDCYGLDQFSNVILVVTKKDILPKSTKLSKIIDYVKKRYFNVLDVFVVSNKTKEGIQELYSYIVNNYYNNKIYVVGTTNSGKSSLINQFIDLYGDYSRDLVTVSAFPSTTLDRVDIHFDSFDLIDTPGLIRNMNIVNYLDVKDVKRVMPKKEIKPKSCQLKGNGSLIIDNFARIDYEAIKKNSIIIYVSNDLHVRFGSLKKDLFYDYSRNSFDVDGGQDIVIPGLGFIKCVGKIHLDIYTFSSVVPFVRESFI